MVSKSMVVSGTVLATNYPMKLRNGVGRRVRVAAPTGPPGSRDIDRLPTVLKQSVKDSPAGRPGRGSSARIWVHVRWLGVPPGGLVGVHPGV